jgi:hypothetical protein
MPRYHAPKPVEIRGRAADAYDRSGNEPRTSVTSDQVALPHVGRTANEASDGDIRDTGRRHASSSEGDWIIKAREVEFYPCKPRDICGPPPTSRSA